MARVRRVRINSAGAIGVLTDPAVQNMIRSIVTQAAANANSMEGLPRTERGEIYGFEPSVIENPNRRAGGRVTAVGPSARRRNLENNTLLKSTSGVRI